MAEKKKIQPAAEWNPLSPTSLFQLPIRISAAIRTELSSQIPTAPIGSTGIRSCAPPGAVYQASTV